MKFKDGEVLVVDNHRGLPKIISKMLEFLFGCQSDCAGSVYDAIGMIGKNKYKLVITNNRLISECCSGGNIVVEMARNSISGTVKIIMMSSYKQDESVAEKIGADGFLLKPFEIRELGHTVESLFREDGYECYY